jgi:hypothetical protein
MAVSRRFQIVEDRQRRLSGAGGGDLRLQFGRGARGGKAEMDREAAQEAFGVRRGFEIDEKPAVLAEAFDDVRIMGGGERERRLAHAERARHHNGPVLFEDCLDEFVAPILATDHPRVWRQGGGEDGLRGRRQRRRDDGLGRWWSRGGLWRRRAFAGGDRPCDLHNLVHGFRHMAIALVKRIVEKRFLPARPAVLVLYNVEGDGRRRRQQKGIEMDVLALRLPLADGGDFLLHDVVGRQRVVRDEKDEDVAIAKLALDLWAPIRAAGHQPVGPDFDCALRLRWLQKPGHEGQPLNFAVARVFRLVRVGVADEDDRLCSKRHGAPHP